MKILADESIESEIVAALREAGHSVADIKETSPGIEDEQVLSLASETDSILLTNDKDFGELIYRDRHFSKGVILLRFGKLEIAERIELLKTVLEERTAALFGAFTVVTAVGIRIRR
jgi:predicted nuclease of predicted toxin-antitoxin system